MSVYTTNAAAFESGLTYRQVDHWDRTGLFHPSVTQADGSGTRRCYSEDDVMALRLVRELLEAGIPPRVATIAGICVRDSPIRHGAVCIIGEQAIASTDAEELFRIIRENEGRPVILCAFDRNDD